MSANVATMRPRVVNKIIARALGFRPLGHGYWQRSELGQPDYWRQRPGPPAYASNLDYCLEAVQELLTPAQQQNLYLDCLAVFLPDHRALTFVNAPAVARARALVLALDWLREGA